MSSENSNPAEETGLQFHPGSGLAGLPNAGTPALSEIINRSLVHVQTSKALGMLHRIGQHELYGPDYRLVCAWAEELRLTQEDVLERLTSYPYMRSTLVNGKFKELRVDQGFLEISGLPSISGLKIELLEICDSGLVTERSEKPLSNLDLSILPGLTKLICTGNVLTVLDFSVVPNLTSFGCGNNKFTELDLSDVPNLTHLYCWNNKLTKLNLSDVPNLNKLYCSNCCLVDLDLSKVPQLSHLDCSSYWDEIHHTGQGAHLSMYKFSRLNNLIELDLRSVPLLTDLNCSGNPLKYLDLSAVTNLINLQCDVNCLNNLNLSSNPNIKSISCKCNDLKELDIREVNCLERLDHSGNKLQIIQRTDQNFK